MIKKFLKAFGWEPIKSNNPYMNICCKNEEGDTLSLYKNGTLMIQGKKTTFVRYYITNSEQLEIALAQNKE